MDWNKINTINNFLLQNVFEVCIRVFTPRIFSTVYLSTKWFWNIRMFTPLRINIELFECFTLSVVLAVYALPVACAPPFSTPRQAHRVAPVDPVRLAHVVRSFVSSSL